MDLREKIIELIAEFLSKFIMGKRETKQQVPAIVQIRTWKHKPLFYFTEYGVLWLVWMIPATSYPGRTYFDAISSVTVTGPYCPVCKEAPIELDTERYLLFFRRWVCPACGFKKRIPLGFSRNKVRKIAKVKVQKG